MWSARSPRRPPRLRRDCHLPGPGSLRDRHLPGPRASLVDCPSVYDRKGLYGESGMGYPDNHIRFAVFARAALTVARVLFRTQSFHYHDWQAGLVPALLRGVAGNST